MKRLTDAKVGRWEPPENVQEQQEEPGCNLECVCRKGKRGGHTEAGVRS